MHHKARNLVCCVFARGTQADLGLKCRDRKLDWVGEGSNFEKCTHLHKAHQDIGYQKGGDLPKFRVHEPPCQVSWPWGKGKGPPA